MVDINDRRQYAGDFNGPGGGFTVTTHGYKEQDAWEGKPVTTDNKKEVHQYFRGQKDTQAWKQSNQVAQTRATREHRVHGFNDLGEYANAYHEHLVRVMATRGPGFAEAAGEVAPRHPQTGYGRT